LSDHEFLEWLNPVTPASGSPSSGGAGAEPTAPLTSRLPDLGETPPTGSSSLDTTETSGNSFVKSFLSEKPATPKSLEIGLWDCWAVKFRHSGWRKIREKIHQSMIRTGQSSSRVDSFCTCGAGTYVQRTIEGIEPIQYRIAGSSCHDRLCTPCANARSHRLKLALMQVMHGKRISFITLTLAGKDAGLQEKVDRLYKHFKALRQHPLWSENVRGGAAFLEVKWSEKAKRWHPHLHCICDADFIDQGELSTVWRTISKDSFIVDVRRVRNDEQAAGYVTKYASKPLNTSFANDPVLLDEAMVALKGRRLCIAYGDWYGTPLDFESEELLNEDEIPPDGWQSYVPLEIAIQGANEGDAYWREVLVKAGGEGRWRQALLDHL
jgi:hypothetical protein